jgi:hypothetical protein
MVSSPYLDEFDALLHEERTYDPEVFRDVTTFEEVPLYSRYHQVEFLNALPVVERNRELVRAAVRHLDLIHDYFSADGGREHILRLVSVTGWWVDDGAGGGRCDDGTSELLVPHFWFGNLNDVRMQNFTLGRPVSRCADFVSHTVDLTGKAVFESAGNDSTCDSPIRVYVGFRDDIPARLVGA